MQLALRVPAGLSHGALSPGIGSPRGYGPATNSFRAWPAAIHNGGKYSLEPRGALELDLPKTAPGYNARVAGLYKLGYDLRSFIYLRSKAQMKSYPDWNGDRVKPCPDCNGDGVVDRDTDDERQCPTCGGFGFVRDDDDDREEVIRTSRVLPTA